MAPRGGRRKGEAHTMFNGLEEGRGHGTPRGGRRKGKAQKIPRGQEKGRRI